MIAIAIVWLLAIIHIRGVGPGRLVSNALTILKVVALLGFIAVGLAVSGAAPAPPASASAGAVTATGWLLGLIVVMFVYSGWNAAAYMAEEVRESRSQRAAGAGARHRRGHSDLHPDQRPVSQGDPDPGAGDR